MRIAIDTEPSAGFRAQLDAAFGRDRVARVDGDPGEAQVLLHVLAPVRAAAIAAAPGLRLIQKLGTGVNTIDLDAARAHGVAVCNMPGANAAAVAEMALALLFAVLLRTTALDAGLRAGRWVPDPALLDGVGEVGGRTVGLVGFGHSAERLATVLAALGATVVYTARGRHPDAPYEYLPLPDLLARADVVSLHVPLDATTRDMVDPWAMKPGAVLINVARGGLVDEVRLAAALAEGHLRGAGLDVFADEPVAAAHPLLALPTVVASPHVAWLTPETLARSIAVAADNVARLEAGRPPLHRVV